jgi:hypothetical protein
MAVARLLVAQASLVAAIGLTLSTDRGMESPIVDVKFLGEAGCPFTRKFIQGALNKTLTSKGLADVLRFDFLPFGNAYFSSKMCHSADQEYDPEARNCFNSRCGPAASERSEDCFRGRLVCQHAAPECIGNRWMACARKVAQVPGRERSRASFLGYMPFVHCLARWYDYGKIHGFAKYAANCSASTGLDWESLSHCYNSSVGDTATVEAAKGTPEHLGVPWLYVNGEPMEADHEDELFMQICKALPSSARPQECLSELEQPRFPQFGVARADYSEERSEPKPKPTRKDPTAPRLST